MRVLVAELFEQKKKPPQLAVIACKFSQDLPNLLNWGKSMNCRNQKRRP